MIFLGTCFVLLHSSFALGLVSELIFPKGTVFTITVSLSEFLPKDVVKGFAQVVELDFIYPIVPKDEDKKVPPKTQRTSPFRVNADKMEIEVYRRNQALKEKQRRKLWAQVKAAMERFGFDGEKCMKRFHCEVEMIHNPESALEDLLLILFRKKNLDCHDFQNFCPFSLLQIIFHSRRVNIYA